MFIIGSAGAAFLYQPVDATQSRETKGIKSHPRSSEAAAYRRLYRDARWCGPHGIRKQAFLRDLYTCQRCGCIVIEGNRHHPRAAVANHKRAHKGDEALFFDLSNVETVCKQDHDTLVQREEARGYTIGCDETGRPIDVNHPWNR